MNGTHPRATKLSLQLKTKPIVIPQHKAKNTSTITATASVLTPFNVCTSLERIPVRTPAW